MSATFLYNLKRIHVIQISLGGVFCKHMTNAFIDRIVVWLQDTADTKYTVHVEKNILISVSKPLIWMQKCLPHLPVFLLTFLFKCFHYVYLLLSLLVQEYFWSSVGHNRGVMLLFKTMQSYYIKCNPRFSADQAGLHHSQVLLGFLVHDYRLLSRSIVKQFHMMEQDPLELQIPLSCWPLAWPPYTKPQVMGMLKLSQNNVRAE